MAEGEDLLAAADAAGWPALARFVAAGCGLDGTEVEPECWRARRRWARARGRSASTSSAGRRRRARCASRCGASAIPGNVGTVIRGALAFGAGSVALGPGCADPFGPKAVRASMGAIFAVPVARVADVGELPGERSRSSRARASRCAARAGGESRCVVGAERDGLPADVVAACDRVAHIPIAGRTR